MGDIFSSPAVLKPRYIPKVKKHEQTLQQQVCSYLRNHYPYVIFRSDFSSGLKLSKFQAVTHKKLQSSRAFPDLFIFYPRGQYHGMALELKKEGTAIVVTKGPRKGHIVSNPHIQEQVAMLKELSKLGYYAKIARGFDEAVKYIDHYFGKEQKENITLF